MPDVHFNPLRRIGRPKDRGPTNLHLRNKLLAAEHEPQAKKHLHCALAMRVIKKPKTDPQPKRLQIGCVCAGSHAVGVWSAGKDG